MPIPSDKESAIASYVDETAALLGIALARERRAGVVAAFVAYSDAAALLMNFPLPVEMEQASIYTFADSTDER